MRQAIKETIVATFAFAVFVCIVWTAINLIF